MYNTFKHIRYCSKQLELLLAMQLCIFMQSLSFYLIPLRFIVCFFYKDKFNWRDVKCTWYVITILGMVFVPHFYSLYSVHSRPIVIRYW